MSERQSIGPSGTPQENADPASSATRTKLIVAGVGLLLVAAAYGIGRAQSIVHVRDAQAETADVQQKLDERAGQLQLELESAHDRTRLLEGRRNLSQALLNLESRNFGTASRNLQQAAKMLSESAKDTELATLAKQLTAYQLVATEDVGQQRLQIIQWLDTFDARVPPPP